MKRPPFQAELITAGSSPVSLSVRMFASDSEPWLEVLECDLCRNKIAIDPVDLAARSRTTGGFDLSVGADPKSTP